MIVHYRRRVDFTPFPPFRPPKAGGRAGRGGYGKAVGVVTNRDSTGASPVVVRPVADRRTVRRNER